MEFLKNGLLAVLEYFLHASTWKGLFNWAASAGIFTLSPTKEGAATAFALAAMGLIQVFVDDSEKTKTLSIVSAEVKTEEKKPS